ncbi:MAG: T9SS type A sorting domain-containing protein [bacterium]|nr:MAG: T9SS type A sorting domain-containing protein [bacterium]
MQIRTIVTSFALVVLMTSLAMSQSLVRESFSYPATLDGLGLAADGWGGNWAIDPTDNGVEGLAVVAGNVFNYDDLNWEIPDTGNHIQVTKKNAWSDHQRYKRQMATTWPNEAGQSYWVSYLLDVKEPLPVGNTYFMVKLYHDDSELLAIGKGGGRDTSPPVWTCGSGWPGMSGDDVSDVEIVAGPVWLVVRIDMSGGAGSERTFMWVDPDPMAEPDTNSAIVKRNSSMPNGINTIGLEFGGDGENVVLIFDEIRIASSYADMSTPITSVRLTKNNIPYRFALSQNYPNPFNPVTNISYTLKSKGKVRLSVYDIRGREVVVLVDGVQNPGSQIVRFSGSNLVSGIYFYRLQTVNGVITKKMTLIK